MDGTLLFDRLGEVLSRGDVVQSIAELIDEDGATAKKLALEASAVLIAGSARQSASRTELLGVILADVSTEGLTSGTLLPNGEVSGNSQPMMQMLGPRWAAYVTGLAEVNEVSTDQIESVLKSVAPIVAAVVKERQETSAVDLDELGSMLRTERDRIADLGLLSWVPHPIPGSEPLISPALRPARNVAKHRSHHRSHNRSHLPADGQTFGSESEPTWVFWLLALSVVLLAIVWTLSLVL